jgi:hypothetical protein
MLGNLIDKHDNFKRRKLKICGNPPKLFMISYFFPKIWYFWEIFQRVPSSMALGTFFLAKNFPHKKKIVYNPKIKLTENNANVVSWPSCILHLYRIKLCQIAGTNSWAYCSFLYINYVAAGTHL